MKSYYYGLDVLRGVGIFFVLVLHTAFYYYSDIYSVDLDNPSLVITIIGFLLMFAGLFAMISGVSHTIQFLKSVDKNESESRTKYMLLSGLFLLVIAYLYFIFTGPGIIHFETQSMDESLLVSLINQGTFQALSLDRILYVDSLVMLGMNILLLALFLKLIRKKLNNSKTPLYLLLGASLFMILSYARIPLYNLYLDARDSGNFFVIFLLNFIVSKNNPILPFFGFALFGAWIALLLNRYNQKQVSQRMIPVALIYIVLGITGYILAPETMLERAIDPTWYFIMVTQIGLFMLLILLVIRSFDWADSKKHSAPSRFISRFGIAGLTPFFFESILSALVFQAINLVFQAINLVFDIKLSIPGALLYGFSLAMIWGLFLYIWEKKKYRYGIEWLHSILLSKYGNSSKKDKLEGKMNA